MSSVAAPTAEELSVAMLQVVLSASNQRQAERTLASCHQQSTPDNIKFVLAIKHLSALQEKSERQSLSPQPGSVYFVEVDGQLVSGARKGRLACAHGEPATHSALVPGVPN